ncbi:hypothetical protein CEXT_47451 [Caerostris extrusa]|uniref:Uncharacterized protein n=1 Tax=Caerostris extrusa TaxID=172846 RepID=A0AAV4VLU7_CAEEX|nr:hypothetical protein CEXT_47451 [Caerostris extrusa]
MGGNSVTSNLELHSNALCTTPTRDCRGRTHAGDCFLCVLILNGKPERQTLIEEKPHSLVDAHNQSAPLNTSPATTCSVPQSGFSFYLTLPPFNASTKHQPTVPRTLLNSSCGKHTQCFASDKACDMGIPEF